MRSVLARWVCPCPYVTRTASWRYVYPSIRTTDYPCTSATVGLPALTMYDTLTDPTELLSAAHDIVNLPAVAARNAMSTVQNLSLLHAILVAEQAGRNRAIVLDPLTRKISRLERDEKEDTGEEPVRAAVVVVALPAPLPTPTPRPPAPRPVPAPAPSEPTIPVYGFVQGTPDTLPRTGVFCQLTEPEGNTVPWYVCLRSPGDLNLPEGRGHVGRVISFS